MAKLGRYSADRKKIQEITGSKVIKVSECGTLFMLNVGTSNASNIDLPDPGEAGKGWWCKFIVATESTAQSAITIRCLDTAGSAQNDKFSTIEFIAADAAGEAVVDSDTMQIAAAAIKGVQVEVVTDGVQWYALAFSSADAGIVVAS